MWVHIEFTEEEEDGDAEVFKASVSSGAGLDELDLAVESFGSRVGGVMLQVGEQSGEMVVEHLGDFDQMAVSQCEDFFVPVGKEGLACFHRRTGKEVAEVLLDGPGASRFQIRFHQSGPLFFLVKRKVGWVLEPQVFGLG